MKNQVLNYFQNLPKTKEEQYNAAFQLYRNCPGKSLAQESFYNRSGYSPTTLENLHYDLKKLVDLKESEIRNAQVVKAVKKVVLTLEMLLSGVETKLLIAFLKQHKVVIPKLPVFEKGPKGNLQRKYFCKANEIVTTSGKSIDLDADIAAFHYSQLHDLATEVLTPKELKQTSDTPIEVKATSKEEVFTTAPDEVKEAIKLRDEFPFLDDKDCPEELYVLVGKKFAHHKAYVAAAEKLLVNIVDTDKDASPINLTQEEVNTLALSAVEDFEINQNIYAELTHYKETGTIFGKHPIFVERQLKESIDALTVEKATKRISNLDNYIRRDSKKLETLTGEKLEALETKIANWKIELGLIKAKFNFSDQK